MAMKSACLFLLVAGIAVPGWAQHDAKAHPAPAPAAESRRPAQAAEISAWTRQPLLLPAQSPRGERGTARLLPRGIAADKITVFAPEGPSERRQADYPVTPEGATITSVTPKIGNYHWVIARTETPEEVRVASTAWYFGNPGDSPKELLTQAKHELEIVPDPLPREHGSYRESEKWRFLVRLNGQPLANQPLILDTEFGSRSTFFTDTAGVATVLFPRDFKPAERKAEGAESHGPRRAKFVLATETTTDGRRYLTAFNLTYGQDGDRNKSLGWGATFGLIGMLAATPLLRRRNSTSGDVKNA